MTSHKVLHMCLFVLRPCSWDEHPQGWWPKDPQDEPKGLLCHWIFGLGIDQNLDMLVINYFLLQLAKHEVFVLILWLVRTTFFWLGQPMSIDPRTLGRAKERQEVRLTKWCQPHGPTKWNGKLVEEHIITSMLMGPSTVVEILSVGRKTMNKI